MPDFIPTADWGQCVSAEGVATLRCIPVVVQNIVNFLVLFAGIVCVFLIIYSGYKFIMSEGDPERISMARKTFLFALAGFVFILLSFFFLNFIAQYTGVQQIAPR